MTCGREAEIGDSRELWRGGSVVWRVCLACKMESKRGSRV
jgi:hypothetical protein